MPGGGSLNSSPAAAAVSRRWFQSRKLRRNCWFASRSSARVLSTASLTALSTAALSCRRRRFLISSSNQLAITISVPQMSVNARAMAADDMATGAMFCHTDNILSVTLGRDSSAMALCASHIEAMIIWTLNRPKYHRLYLDSMLQMDSRLSFSRASGSFSSGLSRYLSSSGLSVPVFCANLAIPGSWSAARWLDRLSAAPPASTGD